MNDKPIAECEVCGKSGKAASKCTFQRACSCWYGVPCVNGESIRKHNQDVRPVAGKGD